MTEPNNLRENHGRTWPAPPRRFDTNLLTGSGAPRTHSSDARQLSAEVIAHIVIALSRYLRHLRAESRRVPAQLEDFSIFLAGHVRQCQDVPLLDRLSVRADPPVVPSRLLLTKSEAAERLGVSLRTIERLISAGRLPLVHVEGAARVRVADLETYVQSLQADDRTKPSPAD